MREHPILNSFTLLLVCRISHVNSYYILPALINRTMYAFLLKGLGISGSGEVLESPVLHWQHSIRNERGTVAVHIDWAKWRSLHCRAPSHKGRFPGDPWVEWLSTWCSGNWFSCLPFFRESVIAILSWCFSSLLDCGPFWIIHEINMPYRK